MPCRMLSVVFILFTAVPAAHAQVLEDFSLLARAVGKEVSVVDRSGLIREGIIEAVAIDGLTLRVGSDTQFLPRADIASAEKLKDDSSDGAFRGAAWALLFALMPNQGYSSSGEAWRGTILTIALFTATGYYMDASEANRQPIYRAPAQAPAPTLRFSWRF